MQVGRFHAGGQQYSLMTMDVMRQLRDDDRDALPLTSVVYIGNSMHVVEPVTNDTDQLTDETGKPAVRNGLRSSG